jgi:6-pyruvoyltetrahydropterin/6-carboxytetrahydropterin synthase
VFDAKRLSTIIKEFVIGKLDHKNLNVEVDFLKGKICTIENLVMGIWEQLIPHMPEYVYLHSLKLYETEKIYVEYFG